MRRTFLGFVLVLAFVFAVPAFAAGNAPSQAVYNTAGAKVQAAVAKVSAKASKVKGAQAKGTKATLPFTGLDLGIMFGAGLLLVGTGLSLRLLTRERSAS
jgi:hypothetical protein